MESDCPQIPFTSPDVKNGTINLLLDTGSDINLLKENMIASNIATNRNRVIRLTGINEAPVKTKGSVTIRVKDIDVVFHLIDENFPLRQDGIIGSGFLSENNGLIDFTNKELLVGMEKFHFNNKPRNVKVMLAARTKKLVNLEVLNKDKKEGYVENIDIGPGIFAGKCLTTIKDGKCSIFVINTNNFDVEASIPPIEVDDFLELPKAERSIKMSEEEHKERMDKLKELIDLSELNQEEKDSILDIVADYSAQFYLPGDKLGYIPSVRHKIEMIDNRIINVRQYRHPVHLREEIKKQIDNMLKNDIIERSVSSFNSCVFVVPKKSSSGERKWRLVIDFRKLNEATHADNYPLPLITEILESLDSARYFTTVDLASGFYQVLLEEESRPLTAFSANDEKFMFKRLPMGLKNSPAAFLRALNHVLSGLKGTDLLIYMDDVIIFSHSLKEHYIKIRKLLERLKQAGLALQPDKCLFLRKEITFLGHKISSAGVSPDETKVMAVSRFPRPRNTRNIKEFLGLSSYYRRFIPQYSKIARNLSVLLRKDVKFTWGPEQEEAFQTLKEKLTTSPILQYPRFNEEFIVTCDASNYAIAGVLSQMTDGKDLPVSYTSRVLSKTEEKFSTIEKELLSVVHSISTFRPYLYGRKFQVFTDHKPIVYLNNFKETSPRLLKMKSKLSEFEFTIKYKKGSTNTNSDSLSRNPVNLEEEEDTPILTSAEIEKSLIDKDEKEERTNSKKDVRRKNKEPILQPEKDEADECDWDGEQQEDYSSFITQLGDMKMNSDESSNSNEERALIRMIESKFYNPESEKEMIEELEKLEITESKNKSNDTISIDYETIGINITNTKNPSDKEANFIEENNETKERLVDRSDQQNKADAGSKPPCLEGRQDRQVASCLCVSKDKSTNDQPIDMEIERGDGNGSSDTTDELRIETTDHRHRNVSGTGGSKRLYLERGDKRAAELDRQSVNPHVKRSRGNSRSGCSSEHHSERVIIKKQEFVRFDGKTLKIVERETKSFRKKIFRSKSHEDVSNNLKEQITKRYGSYDNMVELTTEKVFVTIIDNIVYTRDPVWLYGSSVLHFLSCDASMKNNVTRDLVNNGIIKRSDLTECRPETGEVLVTKYRRRIIFNIFIKDKYTDFMNLEKFYQTLNLTIKLIEEEKVKSICIQKDNNFARHEFIVDRIKRSLDLEKIKMTICTGEVIVPRKELRASIIQEAHGNKVYGHKGTGKSFYCVRRNYFWKGMKKQIEDFVRTCPDCQRIKTSRHRTRQEMMITTPFEETFERVQLDIVGVLPTTPRGNKYLLTMIDAFSRMVEAVPLQKIDAENIAKAFTTHYLLRYSCPKSVHTDNGSNFVSRLLIEFTKIFNIDKIRSTIYRPESLGILERTHHELCEYIRYFINDTEWDSLIPFAVFSFNTQVSDATGYSPFEMVYGKPPRLPNENPIDGHARTYNNVVDNMIERWANISSKAKERIAASKAKAKKYYDRKLNVKDFKPDEYVYLAVLGRREKFEGSWRGPYRVLTRMNSYNYLIEIGRVAKLVHANHLKLAHLRLDPIEDVPDDQATQREQELSELLDEEAVDTLEAFDQVSSRPVIALPGPSTPKKPRKNAPKTKLAKSGDTYPTETGNNTVNAADHSQQNNTTELTKDIDTTIVQIH